MNSKKSLGFLGLGVLLVLALLSFASATITFSGVPTLSRSGNSATITVNSNEVASETVTFSGLAAITTANGKVITFTLPTPVTVNASSPQTVTINYIVQNDSQFTFGDSYSTTLTATGTASPAASQTLTFENIPSEYLNLGGNLAISIDDLSNDGFGDDENWFPLDKITAKINVQNDGPDKIKSISVSYGLYDTANKKWIFKDKASSFSLNDGDDKTVTVDFQLTQLSKFDVDNTGNYKFYAWATGEDEEFDSQKTSVTTSQDIEMQFENDFVVLDNVQISSVGNPGCGEQVEITADVVNIGSDDQDSVSVRITNTNLGINNQQVQMGDIDSMDTAKLDFTFTVPDDATEGLYQIRLGVYDENGDLYVSEFGDDDSVFNLPITVAAGTCTTNLLPVTVTASLESAAVAGKELDVQAVIKNTASTTQTFGISLTDYTSWASLTSIDKTSVTLNAGQSQTVLIRLNVNNGVSGDQNFNIVMTQAAKVLSQPVSVSVQGSSSGGGFNFTGFFSGAQGNTYLWVIGALNVLLVLIIIIVAVRVVRRK